MSAEAIAEMVQAYRDGASTTELRRRYELSQGSVIKILHRHGVKMRGHGMTDDDLPAAAELYCRGATLAQLGERFGVSANAVRRALASAGVVIRPRGGCSREVSRPASDPVRADVNSNYFIDNRHYP
jgi:hypothetical protein